MLEHSDQVDRLAAYEYEPLLHLQHGGTVLYILRRGSPVDVLRMFGGYHLCQLLDKRKHRISNDVCIYRQLFETVIVSVVLL